MGRIAVIQFLMLLLLVACAGEQAQTPEATATLPPASLPTGTARPTPTRASSSHSTRRILTVAIEPGASSGSRAGADRPAPGLSRALALLIREAWQSGRMHSP